MKINKYTLSLLMISMVLLVACRPEEAEEISVESNDKTPVVTALPIEMSFEESFLSIGTFEASDLLKVYTGGSGEIERIMVEVGDRVNSGDLLFTLDQSTFENDYVKLESQLRTVRDNANTLYKDAQNDFEQNSILFESGALSKAELDTYRSALSLAKKNYQDAVTAYKAQLAISKEALEDRMVTSPMDGQVGAIYIDEKESVTNQIAIEIVNDDQMFVNAMVTGKTLAYIAEGDSVRIYPDGEMGGEVAGIIESYNVVANESNGMYEVHVLVQEPIPGTRTGEYAELEFIVKEQKGLAVLRKSVITENGIAYIYVVEEGMAFKREVLTGSTSNQYIEIMEGIGLEDYIIIQGQSFLKDGQEVYEEIQSKN